MQRKNSENRLKAAFSKTVTVARSSSKVGLRKQRSQEKVMKNPEKMLDSNLLNGKNEPSGYMSARDNTHMPSSQDVQRKQSKKRVGNAAQPNDQVRNANSD